MQVNYSTHVKELNMHIFLKMRLKYRTIFE